MHNFLGDGEFAAAPPGGRGAHALFAGRLVEEKGADTAIPRPPRGRAARDRRVGPGRRAAERLAREHDAPVTFLGRIAPEQMPAVRSQAAFALAPSRWDEPCPYAVIEAMAAGLPVLASERGGLPEMVGEENVLPDRDVARVGGGDAHVVERRRRAHAPRRRALARARELFGEERFYSALMDVYEGRA